ncbi:MULTISPECIES: small acid-soluble spore protein Tlp [Brevibacillus]|uniref:small acid-soluble spore protein Tlp n=1 Tax=Brevibacillus TaxID=55080 RepID=UPI000B9B7562|nr:MULTISPECIES: small acid-soluble spore protein Tlp [Brevibacillus]MBG9804710.1 spore protein [Brevibacillus laterosporus]MED1789455.1 small acid-soluble spore protein Tlp [Brevibacillus laterosporus]MED4762038.1 small acid-soluble spore protein Tlp [Brevibacillus laterosporus]RFB34635.1 small acid-soluble spore protein Tlp [Brevibacillus sp. VP]TPH23080.1 small acid-soluble spore protein Tlp [Brevibacillus laterosporus]
MAKPDDRSDNVAKLKQMIENTQQNISETKDYLQEHGNEISNKERSDLENKNSRRENSLDSFSSEVEDELQ